MCWFDKIKQLEDVTAEFVMSVSHSLVAALKEMTERVR